MTRRPVTLFDPAPVLAHYPGLTNPQVAANLGVSPNTVNSWRTGRRQIKRWTADNIACKRLGIHPTALWPDWYAA